MMNSELRKRCISIMDELIKHPCAYVFTKPIVLPEGMDKESSQQYSSVIKHPVDLTLVRNNLLEDHYKDLASWENDMRYIWINAEKINKKDRFTVSLARELKKQFRKQYKQLKLLTVSKWARAAANLKDELDALLDSPPENCQQYATISVQEEEDYMKSFTEHEKSALGRATLYMSSPQDQKKIAALLAKYKTPITQCDGYSTTDINSLTTSQLHELRAMIEKRLSELNIPYPK